MGEGWKWEERERGGEIGYKKMWRGRGKEEREREGKKEREREMLREKRERKRGSIINIGQPLPP